MRFGYRWTKGVLHGKGKRGGKRESRKEKVRRKEGGEGKG